MSDEDDATRTVVGKVKWFDPVKGFGFVVPEGGGRDILLHANVLRNFGQSSVADDSGITLVAQNTSRGEQAVTVVEISPPEATDEAPLEEISAQDHPADEGPLEPARVKWFDKAKGFGFANVFGQDDDIFLHVEVLRRSGFSDLQPGEAVSLRIVEGKRGRMASRILAWDAALKE
ncbi:cold-shock protein [Anianabacter salinae]|uniref:cold-shock protein n=1 Tax=Anianabacter salinae TaxID=2851023 RepID=UPI00225DF70C|nr:cold shock domain-containing protein [Anianabacter salinae]MBV0911571.1 cold shock domain-containing protein [Anianabacter salinae]